MKTNSRNSRGIVYLVGAGPGDPGLITLRGLSLLRQAGVVVHDRLVSSLLLEYAPNAEWIDVGKQPEKHPVPQPEINALLIEKALSGETVVRLKGGDPFVFGRGGEEALALHEAGIRFEIVPGVSSAVAVPAYAGIPVTCRHMAQSAAFITGHDSKDSDSIADWAHLANMQGTLVFLMGVKNLPQIVRELIAAGRSPQTPVALIERGTCAEQKTVVGSLQDIVERAAGVRPPAIIVVGEVVGLRASLEWFEAPEARPLLGLCVLDTRPVTCKPVDFSWDECQHVSQIDAFRLQLANLGTSPIYLPAARVEPVSDPGQLDEVIEQLARPPGQRPAYDRVIFTSGAAIEFFFDRIASQRYDVRLLAGLALDTLGREAAKTLSTYSLATERVLPLHSLERLAAEIEQSAAKRLLLIRADADFPELCTILRARGVIADELASCTLQPVEPQAAALTSLVEKKADVITFFSPYALHGLLESLRGASIQSDRDLLANMNQMAVACSDPLTADAVRRAGLRVDIVSEEGTTESMLEALLQWRVP